LAAAAIFAVAGVALAAGGDGQVGVGLVLDHPLGSHAGDAGEYATFDGLLRAKQRLHVQVKAVAPNPTSFIDLAPYDFLARRHYSLVISLPFLGGLSQSARGLPKVRFVALDGTRQELEPPVTANVEGTLFHTEQAAYLAGFVAASMVDRKPPPHVVSTIGGNSEPQVQAYIAGFQAGAKRADPEIKLLNTYSGDFVNAATCEQIALGQIAQGSRVVFAVAGDCGQGALEAAKRKGVFGVGVDTDESGLGRFILTSVVINWKLGVYDLARRFVHGRLPMGGNLSFDMRDHFVGLGKFSPKVPPALRRYVLTHLATRIEQGKIVVPAALSSSR